MSAVVLNTINLRAKFEVSSFIRSKDIMGPQNFKMRYGTLTHPFVGGLSPSG